MQTLPISEVSRLRTPSCLCATNPPFLHDRAWQTVYFSPQTHLLGKSDKGILLFSFPQTQSDVSTSFLQGIPQVHKQENMAKNGPWDDPRSDNEDWTVLPIEWPEGNEVDLQQLQIDSPRTKNQEPSSESILLIQIVIVHSTTRLSCRLFCVKLA